MSLRRRRGGLIPRAAAWARLRVGRPSRERLQPPEASRPEEVGDRLELARRRLKQTVPPPGEP